MLSSKFKMIRSTTVVLMDPFFSHLSIYKYVVFQNTITAVPL